MKAGERQVAPTRDGIRRDHVARYEWAAARIHGSSAVDVACGVGYGAKILAERGLQVLGIERDPEAIAYALEHYRDERVRLLQADVSKGLELGEAFDAAVCFETIEHLQDPLPLLKSLRCAPVLFASVPNEDVVAWAGHSFHVRHYTKAEFEHLLNVAGWRVKSWHGQVGKDSEVEKDQIKGRTLVAIAERTEQQDQKPAPTRKHVAILGMGPSLREYIECTKRLGGKSAFCDETWGINAVGDIVQCDRVFHMDDVRVQEIRAAARPDSNIAKMLGWMRKHPGPIVTSRLHPDYPGLVEFPLEEMLNRFPNGYFNSTAAYAVAYAVFIGATKITCFGMDFTYPNAHDAEKGRACVEFWLGVASAQGIVLSVPKGTSLLDAIYPPLSVDRFYGYDCVDLKILREGDRIRVGMTEKTPPTADEIEARYDHSQHPNGLVSGS